MFISSNFKQIINYFLWYFIHLRCIGKKISTFAVRIFKKQEKENLEDSKENKVKFVNNKMFSINILIRLLDISIGFMYMLSSVFFKVGKMFKH